MHFLLCPSKRWSAAREILFHPPKNQTFFLNFGNDAQKMQMMDEGKNSFQLSIIPPFFVGFLENFGEHWSEPAPETPFCGSSGGEWAGSCLGGADHTFVPPPSPVGPRLPPSAHMCLHFAEFFCGWHLSELMWRGSDNILYWGLSVPGSEMALRGILVTLVMPSLVWSNQRWAEEPTSSAVNPGEEAVLACKVVNMGGDCRYGRHVSWKYALLVSLFLIPHLS